MVETQKQINSPQIAALYAAINELERKAQHVSTMTLAEKNTIAGELLEAIFDGMNLRSEPLLNMAVRRFKIMVEHGAWSADFMVRLKSIAMVALRSEQQLLLADAILIYQPILLSHHEVRLDGVRDLGIIACLALKASFLEAAENCAKIILILNRVVEPAEEELNNTILQMLTDIMTMTARIKSESTYCTILQQTLKSFEGKVTTPASNLLSEFLLTILFAAADRKWEQGLVVVDRFVQWLVRRKVLNSVDRKKIVYEWILMIGQITRRNWYAIANHMMLSLFSFLAKSRDRKATLQGIRQMAGSMQMYAAWDGFEKAFKAYYVWQIALLVLLDLSVKQYKNKKDDSLEVAQSILRILRDVVVHISRLALDQPEATVFSRWFELWQATKAPQHVKVRAQRLLQLTAQYWAQLQPQKSKNKMPHMIQIFQPNLIDERYRCCLND
ncbi:MAG: hypothetical protein RSF75_04100 [Acidaminococcaceae bacterium]